LRQGIEGFAGTDEGRLIARRILDAGGRIDLIALDEPLFFASIYDGLQACHWDAEQVAAEVGEYIDVMHGFFPELVVGDTEPLAKLDGAPIPLARDLPAGQRLRPGLPAWISIGTAGLAGEVKRSSTGRQFGVPVESSTPGTIRTRTSVALDRR
jgi:hypothetical protein